MYLRERIFDELGRVANRYSGQQIEINRDARELIEVVHRLRPDHLRCRCDGAQRNKIGRRASRGCVSAAAGATLGDRVPAVTAHIQIIEIARRRALVVFHFKDDLILVVRLLDEIDVVLRVGVP